MKKRFTRFLAVSVAAMLCLLTACAGEAAGTAGQEKDKTTGITGQENRGESDTTKTSDTAAPDTKASSRITASYENEPTELVVFAAASLTETLTEIAAQYQSVAPHVTLVFNFDSSGTLKTQIEEGASCDLFLSAAQKQMNQLDLAAGQEANPDGLDFVNSETRVNLLENKVVLVVPEGNPAGIESFDDLASDRLSSICLGNDDVPVGQYSREILTGMGVLENLESEGKITYGSNVKEVTTQVSEGVVDCGIIYATDAFSAGLTVVDEATADMCGQVIYPAAVLKNSEHSQEAQAFLDFLKTPECRTVFEHVGFSMAE